MLSGLSRLGPGGRLLAQAALLALIGCSERAADPPKTVAQSRAIVSPATLESRPDVPSSLASEAQCARACQHVADLATWAEQGALSGLAQGLVTQDLSTTRAPISAAIAQCGRRCQAETGASLAQCLAIASDMGAVATCLRSPPE